MRKLAISEHWIAYIMVCSGSVAMFCLLLYTAWHTGGLLSRHITPPLLGYIAAFGVEATVVTLSAQLGQQRKNQQRAWGTSIVLALVVLVSALANISEGFMTRYATELTVKTALTIDMIPAVTGLTATGLISVIVFALADLLSQNVKSVSDKKVVKVVSDTENITRSMSNPLQTQVVTDSDILNNDVSLSTHDAKHRRLLWIDTQTEPVTSDDLVRQFGVTPRTAYRDLQTYRNNGYHAVVQNA